MFLLPLILGLLLIAWNLLLAIVQIVIAFVLALLVGILAIVRAALPYALRAACLAAWLGGIGFAYAHVAVLYASFGAAPVFLIAAVPCIALTLAPFLLRSAPNTKWGAFFACGIGGIVLGYATYLANSPLVRAIVSVLPVLFVLVFSLTLIYKFKIAHRHPSRKSNDEGDDVRLART